MRLKRVLRFKRKRKITNAKIYEDKRDLYCIPVRRAHVMKLCHFLFFMFFFHVLCYFQKYF